jgi:hypothetical protein
MVVLRLRVHPAALPVVGCEPFLEIEEPQRRPGHDRQVEPHPRPPFVFLRQIETEPGRFLLIEMRNAPAAGERVQIRTVDEDLRLAALLELDPDVVVPAEGRRRRWLAPGEPSGAQFAFSAADRIAAEIDELLRRGQRLSPAHSHR